MQGHDWLVTENGICEAWKPLREWDLLREEYRLYRFLTEVEDTHRQAEHQGQLELEFLPKIRQLVRQLIINSYWVKTQLPQPCPKTGVSVLLLYDELGCPFTVQTVTFSPGVKSNIHNHGTWGIIGILQGQERNIFWKRSPHPNSPHRIEPVSETILHPGDIITFTSEAIHSVEAIGEQPTITFNLYGETRATQRFEFDPIEHTAKNF